MPIPKPKPGEAESAFISRCVFDEAMTWEYPNRNQRLAVCYGVVQDARKEQERRNNERPKEKD